MPQTHCDGETIDLQKTAPSRNANREFLYMNTLALVLLALAPGFADSPIALHPENSRYFIFQGKPTVLVGSTEHYGAVLNLDFDFIPYLDELQARGFNLTRAFSGTYREVAGSFRIRDNTLAPQRFIIPWTATPDGKVDLDRFDLAYFKRAKEFLRAASRRGIVVEYVFFCPLYEDELWAISPLNVKNNVNGVGDCKRDEVFTLKHPDLLKRQLAFVAKAVQELNEFDNLYFEICNEPYFGGVTLDWQARVADTIVAAEKPLPKKHLIAQNIANNSQEIKSPDPRVSIFNFHYAVPEAARANLALKKPIGDDETGFKGIADHPYRSEAWLFLLSGGAIFDHLDYSFTASTENGSAKVTPPTPGGGGPEIRKQFHFLKSFIESFDFIHMSPDLSFVVDTDPTIARERTAGMVESKKAYALYIDGGERFRHAEGRRIKIVLELPRERYRLVWIDPKNGPVGKPREIEHMGGRLTLEAPPDLEDVAVRIVVESKNAAK